MGVSRAVKQRRRKSSVGSKLITFFGLGLILAGVSVLGYIGWQYYGTNIIAQREHESLRTEITERWESGQDMDAVDGKVPGVGLLRVPRFGADYEVPVLTGFDDATLAKSVGHYPDGVGPGEVGNFVLAGHRVTHGEPFRGFLELRQGDEIIIETQNEIFTYQLRGNGNEIEVDFRTSWPLAPVPDPQNPTAEPTEKLITLVTCSEIFHTDARSVVIGELVNVEQKPAPQV